MTLLPCIYCRRTEVPRTKEHVLQHALGASATLPTAVCDECNNAFSPIDKYFVEALPFYHTGGKKMLRGLGLGRMALEDGVSVNVLYRSGGAVFPPQLVGAPGTNWRYVGSGGQDYDAMARELRNPADITIESMVVPQDDGVPELTILRSSPNTYLVQGWDEKSLNRTCEGLRANGLHLTTDEGPASRDDIAGTAHFPTSLKLAPYCRAMAKIALNYVCYRCGAETALRSEFDNIRGFARYGQGHPFDFVVPTVLNMSLADSYAAFFRDEHHGLVLFKVQKETKWHEGVAVVVSGRVAGRVDLLSQGKGLPDDTWILLSRFTPESRAVVDFTLREDMHRAVVNPAALGLQDEWPKEWL